jgi:hypothetical protein
LQFPCSLPSSRCHRHLPTQVLCEFIASSIPVVCITLSQKHVFHSPNITSTAWTVLLLYPTTKYFFSILFFNTCTYTLSLQETTISYAHVHKVLWSFKRQHFYSISPILSLTYFLLIIVFPKYLTS